MKDCICIVCPRGCHLHIDDDLKVTGNSCVRGEIYGRNEATKPLRNLTSTVKLEGSELPRLPVKTDGDIPKEKMFDVMEEINKAVAKAPIKSGDIVIANVLDLGVNVVATRTVEK